MTYETRLTQILEEILDCFEDDPELGWITYESGTDNPIEVSDDLNQLLDRANAILYGCDDDGLGFPTEESE